MRLRATVRTVTENTLHLLGTPTYDGLNVTVVPNPKTVEIIEQDGAIYLLRFDGSNQCIADTWHETVDAAKAQANFEYEIEDGDWKDIELH